MADPTNELIHNIVAPFIPVGAEYQLTTVQSLWSGYGEITRCQLINPDSAIQQPNNLKNQPSFIAKVIALDAFKQGDKPQHPRAWQSDFAHQRKLSSYRNECNFYAKYSQQTHTQCSVPKVMFADYNDSSISIVMEDLDNRGLSFRHSQASPEIAATGIKWLANFHACFMQQGLAELWPVGTYWHLSTRPQEYASMHQTTLKNAAEAIDNKLNRAKYQTLLHGDAKLANFCFSADALQAAAVDFQYTGRGVGVKDLIYFLGSCFTEFELQKYAEPLIDLYFDVLKINFKVASKVNREYDCVNSKKVDFTLIEQEWRELIPYAWADFERFLAGWAPEHIKRHAYSQKQTSIALALLKY